MNVMTATPAAGLPIKEVEKPWGTDTLPPPFSAPEGKRIGEIWFEPPAELPQLLIKYIFTSEALSVQVHPSDAQTEAAGEGRQGKEECWYIISAEPDAKLGIGLSKEISGDELRAAALDGGIEQLMQWWPVKPGDFFYIPANTIHAIGPGIGLIETQQNSDITYRLYDYGRPRELHLDQSVAVATRGPYPDHYHRHVPHGTTSVMVEDQYFRLDQLVGAPDDAVRARYGEDRLLVIPREGEVSVAGEIIAPGGCGLAGSLADVAFADGGVCLIAQPTDMRGFG